NQSLHDNLLTNLHASPLNSRFGSNPALRDELVNLVRSVHAEIDFTQRPRYSGNETGGGDSNPGPAYAWDVEHGFVPHASGQLVAMDPDTGTLLTFAVDDGTGNFGTTSTGTYGTLTVNPDGSWTYVLDDADADTQALAKGQEAQETFTVQVTDDKGATGTETLTITITGANDAPVITGTAAGSFAPSNVAGITEASASGGLEPEAEIADLQAIINANPTDMEAVLDEVQIALGAGATRATAIAHVWDNLDDHYSSTGYYNTPVNVLFTRLGVEYAKYLQTGGTP